MYPSLENSSTDIAVTNMALPFIGKELRVSNIAMYDFSKLLTKSISLHTITYNINLQRLSFSKLFENTSFIQKCGSSSN